MVLTCRVLVQAYCCEMERVVVYRRSTRDNEVFLLSFFSTGFVEIPSGGKMNSVFGQITGVTRVDIKIMSSKNHELSSQQGASRQVICSGK